MINWIFNNSALFALCNMSFLSIITPVQQFQQTTRCMKVISITNQQKKRLWFSEPDICDTLETFQWLVNTKAPKVVDFLQCNCAITIAKQFDTLFLLFNYVISFVSFEHPYPILREFERQKTFDKFINVFKHW